LACSAEFARSTNRSKVAGGAHAAPEAVGSISSSDEGDGALGARVVATVILVGVQGARRAVSKVACQGVPWIASAGCSGHATHRRTRVERAIEDQATAAIRAGCA
jgi:hypothetical protein